jgi:hypothetical protein
MKTVTQNFKDAQKAPSAAMVRQLWYKRRYWVESSKSYTWEANWTQLTEDKVVEVSDITWQLDIQTLNEFKTSNVTITLENLNNQWIATNPYGKFAADSTSPIWGYYPNWTKFQIRAGLNFVAVGSTTQTTEVVNIFTGLATEYTLDSSTGAMQINLTGEESLLIGANAESVSTAVTNETLTGSADGSNKVFTTAHNAVGIITEVSDNGIAKRAGADYSLSQLNDPNNPGKITFVAAPTSGHTIRGSYIYWKTSQKFEDLVTALLNQAGIPGGNQQVTPVTFPSSVINTHTWQTQSDWNGGSLTAIDSTAVPNSIKFLYAAAQTWNDSTSGWTASTSTGPTFSSDGTGIFFTGTTGELLEYRASTNTVGEWQWSFQNSTSGSNQVNQITVWFMANINNGTNGIPTQGYGLSYADISTTQFQINLLVANGVGGDTVVGTAYTGTRDTKTHSVRVRRLPSGAFTVYLDGVSIITGIDSTWTASTYLYYYFTPFSGTPKFYFTSGSAGAPPGTTGIGTWISAAVDFGATPTAWTSLLHSETLNSGVVTYYTATSADNITYDAYVVLPGNQVPGSTIRRYVKVKIVIDIALGDPVVSSASIGATTSSTTITMANFTGMTCYEAITALANFANYEFGFDASENFFFRPKNTGNTSTFTLTESDFNMRVVSMVNGYDRVFSKIRATYAGYLKDISDDGQTSFGPVNRFGYSLQTVDGGNILVSADADVATGMASTFFNYYRLPRRRVKVQCLILPQFDISDVITCSFQDLFPTRWVIGDSSTYVGDTSKSLYGSQEQVLAPMISKIVGLRIDTNNWLTEIDLEEVI